MKCPRCLNEGRGTITVVRNGGCITGCTFCINRAPGRDWWHGQQSANNPYDSTERVIDMEECHMTVGHDNQDNPILEKNGGRKTFIWL